MKTDKVCGLLLLAAGTACAGEWCVVRPITGDAVERATVVAVKVDEHVFANSLPDLADVRVLDAQNREVPRVMQPECDYAFEPRHTPREARIKSLEQVPARGVEVSEDAEDKVTVLTFDTGRQPVIGVTLDPAEQNFERGVTVECSASGGWRNVAKGRVVRSLLPGVTRQETGIVFPETRAERLRVRVSNDDNPPLTFGAGRVTVQRQAYGAVFIAEKGQSYRLVYGNPEVKTSPVYEQGVTAYLRGGQKAIEWRLTSAPEGTVTYGTAVRARQFLAKHGMILLSVLVMAVLGLLIGRAIRHVEKE